MEMIKEKGALGKFKKIPPWLPKELLPFVDRRASPGSFVKKPEVGYTPDRSLSPAHFFSHHLLDTCLCSDGAMRRFNKPGVRRYLVEKFVEEPWVAAGNCRLSELLEGYLAQNAGWLRRQEEIRILDFGPSGGAITTLFALRALQKFGLLCKAKIHLLDIVPQVIRMNLDGDFIFPESAIKEHGLGFAGKDGSAYKRMLGRAVPVVADFHEWVPKDKFHMILNGYAIHHLNIFDKEDCIEFMERNTESGGAIAIVDFFVQGFDEYREWLIRHLAANPDSPAPIESPYFCREQILELFSEDAVLLGKDDGLEKSWTMVITNG